MDYQNNFRNNRRGQWEYLALAGLIIAGAVYAYYNLRAGINLFRSWREK